MKNSLKLTFLAAVLALGMSACGGNKKPAPSETPSEPAQSEPAESEVTPSEEESEEETELPPESEEPVESEEPTESEEESEPAESEEESEEESEAEKVALRFGENTLVDGDYPSVNVHAGEWFYWNDQWWCGSNVGIKEAYKQEDTIHIDYTAEGACEFALQVLFKNPDLTQGVKYQLSAKIITQKAGTVNLCLNNVDLVEGENDVVVHYYEPDTASFKLNVPSSMGDNVLEIIDPVWEVSTKLNTPTNVVVNEEEGAFVLYFAPVADAEKYELKVMDEDGVVLEDWDAVEVHNEASIPGFAALPDGVYNVALRALAEGHIASDWCAPVTVIKGDIELDPFDLYDEDNTNFEYGSENGDYGASIQSVNTPKTFFYWNSDGVSVTEHKFEDRDLTLSYTVGAGAAYCEWGEQIFFKNPYLAASSKYRLEFDITSVASGKYGLNQSGNKVYDLEAGESHVVRDYTETSNNASLALVLPTDLVDANGQNTIVISNITWTLLEE